MLEENEEEAAAGQLEQPRPRVRRRMYRYDPRWEQRVAFRRWLRADPRDASRASCIVCGTSVQANLDTIKMHGRGRRHDRLMRQLPQIDEEVEQENYDLAEMTRKREVSRVNIMEVLFFARNKLAFVIIGKFSDFLVNVTPDSQVLEEARMERTKFTNMTKWVASQHKEDLRNILRNQKFSILFDEATDVSKQKHGAVVVRFFNRITNRTIESLWSIIYIYEDGNRRAIASARVIYDRIMDSFDNFAEIPRRNVLSFCSDGCATMAGVMNSVTTRFRADFPNIICIVCPAHAIQLACKDAYALLPAAIQQLPKNIYNLFNSPKRLHLLKTQQRDLRLPNHAILRATPTRWLVLGPALERLKEQWQAISNVINNLAMEHNQMVDNNARANLRTIQATMADPLTKCYVEFLLYNIPMLESFNGMMQRTSSMFAFVYIRILELISILATRLINRAFAETHDLINIDFRMIHQIDDFNIANIDIGQSTDEALQEVEDFEQQHEFLQTCIRFYVELIEQLKIRLEVAWRPYRNLNWLIPNNAVSMEYHEAHHDIMEEMLAIFIRAADDPDFHMDALTLNAEWANLLTIDLREEVRTYSTIESFWFSISEYRDPESNALLFRNLAQFALSICCIPHANAEPERVWSREKITKTPIRNRLGLPSENAILLIIDMLKMHGCYDALSEFIPPAHWIDGIVEKLYNPPKPRRNRGGAGELLNLLAGEAVEQNNNEQSDNEEGGFDHVAGEEDEDDGWDSEELDVDEIREALLEFEGLEEEQEDVRDENVD